MNVLAFDTSSSLLCAALLRDGPDSPMCLEYGVETGGKHSELLMPIIDSLFSHAEMKPSDLDGIVCGTGPGSFMGLRVAMASAKGMSESLGIPMAGLSGLDAIGHSKRHWPGPVLALLDARKKRYYAALYLKGVRQGEMADIGAEGLAEFVDRAEGAARADVLVSGPDAAQGFEELRAFSSAFSWVLDEERQAPWAAALARLGMVAIREGRVLEAEAGPNYIRESDAELGITVGKKKSSPFAIEPGAKPGPGTGD